MQERSGCLQNRLYVLRRTDGNQNDWAISTIRAAEQAISSEPGFIGIALRGSAAKGYAGPYSDVDLLILFDLDPTADQDKVIQFRKDALSRIERPIVDVRFWNAGLTSGIYPESGNLFRLVTGTRVNGYRATLVDKLRDLSPDERNRKVSSMADFLAKDDVNGYGMIRARIPSAPSMEETEVNRTALWTRRIEGFLVV